MNQEFRTARLLPLYEVRAFVDHEGRIRELVDPDGEPTGRQLLALWRLGALAIVHPDERHQFSKAAAAGAINWLRGGEE